MSEDICANPSSSQDSEDRSGFEINFVPPGLILFGAGSGMIITAVVDNELNGPINRSENRSLTGSENSHNKPFFKNDAQIEFFGSVILGAALTLSALVIRRRSRRLS